MAVLNHPEHCEETLGAPAQHHAEEQEIHPQEALAEAQAGPHPGNLSEDEKKALNIHNQARHDASQSSGHKRPDLRWDDNLAKQARAYAQYLCKANKGLQHSSGDQRKNQGENLYWSKPNGSLEAASKGWVNEKKNYHGEKIGEGNFGSYGHYTQVIWPSTTAVGVALAHDDDGGVFVVGRYSPPGNFSGKNAFQG
ncbi:MAG: hypothetical protein Q9223_001170 [Gallowayella weberi]